MIFGEANLQITHVQRETDRDRGRGEKRENENIYVAGLPLKQAVRGGLWVLSMCWVTAHGRRPHLLTGPLGRGFPASFLPDGWRAS